MRRGIERIRIALDVWRDAQITRALVHMMRLEEQAARHLEKKLETREKPKKKKKSAESEVVEFSKSDTFRLIMKNIKVLGRRTEIINQFKTEITSQIIPGGTVEDTLVVRVVFLSKPFDTYSSPEVRSTARIDFIPHLSQDEWTIEVHIHFNAVQRDVAHKLVMPSATHLLELLTAATERGDDLISWLYENCPW